MELYSRLSDLTPAVVDVLYNIQGPVPQAEPVFVFLVGAPGSGKTSGHGQAIEAGIIPPGNYATINIDVLLESLLPFRSASATAAAAAPMRFSTIGAYTSRKEDLGLFKWVDKASPLTDLEAPNTLIEINEAALQRAIDRRIPIVYETTLYLSKEGRVSKIDALMRTLKTTPYRIVFYHIRGEPAEIAMRLHSRQQATAKADPPFVRTVPTSIEAVTEMVNQNQRAFEVLRKKYKKRAHFEDTENPFLLSASPSNRGRSNRISNSSRRTSSLYISPTSSEERTKQRRHRSTVRNK